MAKVSGLKDHGAASANTWLSCASRELSCWALESVTYLCGGSGLGFISETLWHLGLNSSLPTPCVAGADRDTCAQCSHSLSTPCPPPGTTRDGSGGLQSSSSLIPWRMLQPGAWRMLQPRPGLALAVASRAKALQGLPLSLSPAQLCSALLCAPPDIPGLPEDSPAPALSPNTIPAACLLPHVSFSNRDRLA